MSAPKIVNFTIYGERSSGTVFLEEAITKNFDLPVIWYYDWKHFFGMYDFDTDNANVGEEGNAIDNTIFIGIVREPVAWLNSFSKSLQYVPACNHSLTNFLEASFYSVAKDEDNEIIIQEDVNYITKERFTDIFELRKIKNDFLMNVVRTKVRNYVLITYEGLLNDYDNTLDQIKNTFNLVKTHEKYEKIVNHTNGAGEFTGERTIDFSRDIIDYIWSKLDVVQEEKLGYHNPLLMSVSGPTVETVSENALELVIEEVLEPTVETVSEPTVETVLEPTVELVSEPALEPTVETALEPALEPTVETALEPAVELVSEPTVEAVSEPTVEHTVEPTVELVSEPVVEEVLKTRVLERAFNQQEIMQTKTGSSIFKHFVGIVRNSAAPIVKRNYSPVTKFVSTQIKEEALTDMAPIVVPIVARVIPKIAPMFKTIIAQKQIIKDQITPIKYKKNAFFELSRYSNAL